MDLKFIYQLVGIELNSIGIAAPLILKYIDTNGAVENEINHTIKRNDRITVRLTIAEATTAKTMIEWPLFAQCQDTDVIADLFAISNDVSDDK